MPVECFSCEVSGKPLVRGGDFTDFMDSSAPKDADVIFVFQQGSCLDQFHFKTIIQLLESSFKENKIKKNLYTVVGYGGAGQLVQPHTFTSAGKIYNDFVTVLKAFEGYSFIST